MKILFVYPNVSRQRSPQLGICMVAAVARELGHECRLYDLTTISENSKYSSFESMVASYKPDMLAVSCRSSEWSYVKSLLETCDVKDIRTVFGGPHATVAPEEVITIADVVVRGEGEETFCELLKKIEAGDDTTTIPGSWVRLGNDIYKNAMRDLIQDLDRLPFPYWELFDDIHYYESGTIDLFKGAKVAGAFEASRGCPYSCAYCTNEFVRRLYGGKGRWRREKSTERIIDEIESFREIYGLDCVYWIDEIMLTRTDRVQKFRDLYVSRVGVPFVFMERPENMIDERVKLIKEAGATNVSIGIEAGDERIRRDLLKRKHSNEQIISAFQTAKKYGLTTHAFTMIGFPTESRSSYTDTYALLKKAQPDTVQTTIFYPLRGTRLYEHVVDAAMFDPATSMPMTYYDDCLLDYSKKKKKELVKWQFILSSYKSRFVNPYFIYIPGTLVIRALTFVRKVFVKINRIGFHSTIKLVLWKARVLR